MYKKPTLLSLTILALSVLWSCQPAGNENQDKEEWLSLFNGKDLTGWDIKFSGYPMNVNLLETFRAEDSMIRVSYDKYERFNEDYGHMYYQTPFSYYRIKFDYRFLGEQLEGGATWNVRNSGIMFHSQSAVSNEYDQDFPVSVELQLLGGLGTGTRTTANVCTPGTTVDMDGEINRKHCISSTSKTYDGDQWVHVEATVLGDQSMIFVVEGDTVLTFENPRIDGGFIRKMEDGSDWSKFGVEHPEDWIAKEGNTVKEGYIALQAESHAIDFKNLELLDLCGCMDKSAKNYKSYFVKDDASKCLYD
ncbi:MAG: DUF1080 domain-containing protein [Cyclobacteriaceae bacterium]